MTNRPLLDVLRSARSALNTARADHHAFSPAANVIDQRRNELTRWINHLEAKSMTDRTPQQHADAIKAAAQAYYDAVTAAESDGLTINVDAKRAPEFGNPITRFIVTVEVEAQPERWRA